MACSCSPDKGDSCRVSSVSGYGPCRLLFNESNILSYLETLQPYLVNVFWLGTTFIYKLVVLNMLLTIYPVSEELWVVVSLFFFFLVYFGFNFASYLLQQQQHHTHNEQWCRTFSQKYQALNNMVTDTSTPDDLIIHHI